MTDQHTNLCCATLYDQGFATIGRFCRNSMIQYGRRQGYDVVHSPGGTSDRPISWHKLQLIESLFDTGYEFVFWVDADAVFVDFEPDVADLIQPGKHLYFARPKIDGRYFPNMGIFMLRNCDWSRDLIRQLWSLEQYIDHPWWETAAMKHLLYRDTFADHGIVNFNGPSLVRRASPVDTGSVELFASRYPRFAGGDQAFCRQSDEKKAPSYAPQCEPCQASMGCIQQPVHSTRRVQISSHHLCRSIHGPKTRQLIAVSVSCRVIT